MNPSYTRDTILSEENSKECASVEDLFIEDYRQNQLSTPNAFIHQTLHCVSHKSFCCLKTSLRGLEHIENTGHQLYHTFIIKEGFPGSNSPEFNLIPDTQLSYNTSYSSRNPSDKSFVSHNYLYSKNSTEKLLKRNNDEDYPRKGKGDEIRRSYISKLQSKRIMDKQKNHNSLLIFDWDDTLFFTSLLSARWRFQEEESISFSEEEKKQIEQIEASVYKILMLATERGDTFIITTAESGWVEYSVEKYYPKVAVLLKKITVISLRSEYESLHPGDIRMWKIQAFLNMRHNLDKDLVTNIICIGDSFQEIEAAYQLGSKFKQTYIKAIKLRESASMGDFSMQLSLISEKFLDIFSIVQNLTIRVERK